MKKVSRRLLIMAVLVAALLAVPAIASADGTVITDSNPDDDEKITNRTQTFSATVEDPNFDDGENITVSLLIDGTIENQTTISSNQTVNLTHTFSHGGERDWQIGAYDSSFEGDYTNVKNIFVPADLRIENESDPGTIITNTTEVTFYGNGQIYTRTTSNGMLNLTDLPARDYVIESVVVDGSYIDRSNYILDPYSNKTIYHLPTNATTIESRFVIQDQTGIFSSSAVIQIQRGINYSGFIEYETVSADRFGSEGFTTIIESDQRYRVRIISEDLENFQIIGPYRSDVGETVTVQPGNPEVNVGEFVKGWNASVYMENTTSNSVTYNLTYVDPSVETDKLTVWLTSEPYDGGSARSANKTFYNIGSVVTSYTFPADYQDDTIVAHFAVERNGSSYQFTRTLYQPDYRGVPVDLDNGIIQMIFGLALLLTAGLFSQSNHEIGAVVVTALGGILWYVSLDGGIATIAVLVSAGLIALLFKLGRTR